MHWQANPDEETTDWRAVCGKTASTVRRAGTVKAVSDPYQVISSSIGELYLDARFRGHDARELYDVGFP